MLEYDPMTIVVHSKGYIVSQRSAAVGYTATRGEAVNLIKAKIEELRIFELYFCKTPPVRT